MCALPTLSLPPCQIQLVDSPFDFPTGNSRPTLSTKVAPTEARRNLQRTCEGEHGGKGSQRLV